MENLLEELQSDAGEHYLFSGNAVGTIKASLAGKRVRHLSGGVKQRVSIARALINDPHIILADELTGNLDKKNGEMVFSIFRRLAEQIGQTLLVVTHDQGFAAEAHRIVKMEDGKIVGS